MSAPVVIATNGLGMPVKAVDANAPTLTVAANGLGVPIVLSDRGAPFVVEGAEPPLDPLAVAYFDRIEPQTDYRKSLINRVFTRMREDDLIDKVLGLYDLMAVDDADYPKNLMSTDHNLTLVGTPTHVANVGVTGNGTSAKLNTGFAFPVGMREDAHIGFYSPSTATSDTSDCGNANAAIIVRKATAPTDVAFARLNGAANSSGVANLTAQGHYIVTRTGSGAFDCKLYRNGAVLINSTDISANPDTNPIHFIGRSSPSGFTAKQYGVAHFGFGLTAADVTNLTDILEQYRDAVLAIPITLGATSETQALLRNITSYRDSTAYLLGTHDRWDTPADAPEWEGNWEDFHTMTGKYPSYLQIEYVDPLQEADGATRYANQVARCIEIYDAGGAIMIHDHPGNPINFTLQTSLTSGDLAYNDRTGDPVLNCLAGGTARTAFLDYVSRLANMLNNDLVGSDGKKIPVIIRWFHEINLAFWWSGTDRQANMVLLWKDFVDLLRTTHGVTNAIYMMNWGTSQSVGAWYPGDNYVDLVSADYYNDTADMGAIVGMNAAPVASAYNVHITRPKAFAWAEVGYLHGAANKSNIWKEMTHDHIVASYPQTTMVGLWRPTWGPAIGNTNNDNLVLMTDDANCITLDKAGNLYA